MLHRVQIKACCLLLQIRHWEWLATLG